LVHLTFYSSAATATIAANMFDPCWARSCSAPAALVAAAELAELAALLALEMADEILLDMLLAAALIEDELPLLARTPVLEPVTLEPEVVLSVPLLELFPAAPVLAQVAAVCVNVTPAGSQIFFAYCRVAC